MGFKLSAALGVLLVLSGAAFKLYFDKAQAQIENLTTQLATAAENQKILESEIADQNQAIQDHLTRSKALMAQVQDLQSANQAAAAEAADLRSKFARHDLNMLSLSKPALIEKIINKGTKEVFDELTTITSHN
ncbi:MAG: hypothetical protein CMF11_01575 [Idiomarina sp.]|nr:hypothetical protein [Idiomarina sp.]